MMITVSLADFTLITNEVVENAEITMESAQKIARNNVGYEDSPGRGQSINCL